VSAADPRGIPIGHWDSLPSRRSATGPMDAVWTDLGTNSVTIGARRVRIEPGRQSTPPHTHGAEEEIFYVLSGSGLSWQDGVTHEVGAGDCLAHPACGPAHTLRAGADGLDVIVFGMRVPVEAAVLPRAGVAWLGPSWTDVGGPHPWKREAALTELEFAPPSPRPASIVNLDDAPRSDERRTTIGRTVRYLTRDSGLVRSGLRHSTVQPGMLNVPPHCHSIEEELFVCIGGDGSVVLGGEEHPVTAGNVVARPAGTGVAHTFRGGVNGMELLMYGTREPGDIAFYPRSGKVYLRGVGLVGRIEPAEYWDGED
jgi:uncharacterized cupin superfamily protein